MPHTEPGQGERAVHVEEVDCQDGLGVDAEKCAPPVVAWGRRRDPSAAQDPADCARADPVSQAAQVALEADNAPAPVLAGEAGDQLGEFVVER